MNTPMNNVLTDKQTSVLATNKVPRNTCTLLFMTLFFSALVAGVSKE